MTGLTNSRAFNRIIDSVRVPIEHFDKTGFWDPHALPDYQSEDISEVQVRRACRSLATEQKRPFIVCHHTLVRRAWDQQTYKWIALEEPIREGGYIEMPKKKYLHGHVSTLLLVDNNKIVQSHHRQTLWMFRIHDNTLWNEYYDFILNDPDCRAARRLTS